MVNILRVDGAQLEGIHYLRAFGNSDSIRDDVADAEQVVLVGGSYIGAEVAASLTEMGKRCTIVEIEPVLLSRAFGEEVGRYFHELLESKGRRDRLGARRVAAFEGDERVGAVLTEGGREIAVRRGRRRRRRPSRHDAGRPRRPRGRRRDRLRRGPARPRSRGSSPRATAAATRARSTGGGCASSTGTSPSSRAATPPAGCSASKAPYRVVPYFFSDLADWAALEYVGPAERWDEVIWRGGRESGEFSAWYVADDRVVARPLGRPLRGPPGRPPPDRVGRRAGSRAATLIADPEADLVRDRIRLRVANLLGRPRGPAMRTGVMATRCSLEAEFGVRVPGPQF